MPDSPGEKTKSSLPNKAKKPSLNASSHKASDDPDATDKESPPSPLSPTDGRASANWSTRLIEVASSAATASGNGRAMFASSRQSTAGTPRGEAVLREELQAHVATVQRELQLFGERIEDTVRKAVRTSMSEGFRQQQQRLAAYGAGENGDLAEIAGAPGPAPRKAVTRSATSASLQESVASLGSYQEVFRSKAEPARKASSGSKFRPRGFFSRQHMSSSTKGTAIDDDSDGESPEYRTEVPIAVTRSLNWIPPIQEGTGSDREPLVPRCQPVSDMLHQEGLSSAQLFVSDVADCRNIEEAEGVFSRYFRRLTDFVQSEMFDYIVGVLIIANALLTGLQTDYMAKNWSTEVPWHFAVFDHMFVCAFALEMLLRAVSYGKTYWSFVRRNLLDCIVVTVSVVDELVWLALWVTDADSQSPSPSHSYTALRVVRFLRTLRILRMTRLLSVVLELRMLVVSVLDSMRALIWTIVLIWMVNYMFAVYFTQIVTEYKVAHRGSEAVAEHSMLLTFYGTLGSTMLNLYEVICDGKHWDALIEPLMEHCSPFTTLFFAVYVSIAVIGIMNMVTSVFVTSAMQNVEEDRRMVLWQRMQSFFREADVDHSGTISWDEFQAQVQDPQFLVYLKEIDLHPEHALELFQLLDSEESGDVAIDDIVSGCVRLHGPAKALDHANMMGELERFSQAFAVHKTAVDGSLRLIMGALGVPPPLVEEPDTGTSDNANGELARVAAGDDAPESPRT